MADTLLGYIDKNADTYLQDFEISDSDDENVCEGRPSKSLKAMLKAFDEVPMSTAFSGIDAPGTGLCQQLSEQNEEALQAELDWSLSRPGSRSYGQSLKVSDPQAFVKSLTVAEYDFYLKYKQNSPKGIDLPGISCSPEVVLQQPLLFLCNAECWIVQGGFSQQ
ncbi:unnamed protein product, partial [Durusdinium trenchii]